MEITVKNVDSRTVPDISVTVNSFDKRENNPQLADASRPVFVVNAGPTGGDTANQATSALGPLKPGQTKTFKWDVTAVQAGNFHIELPGVRRPLRQGARGGLHRASAGGRVRGHGLRRRADPTVNFDNGKSVEGG